MSNSNCPDPPCDRLPITPNLIQPRRGLQRDPPTYMFEQIVDSLVNAPFAQDTLFPALTRPERVGAGGLNFLEGLALASGGKGGVLGQARLVDSEIQLNEPLVAYPPQRAEHTMAHETAHLFDSASSSATPAGATRDSINARYPEAVGKLSPANYSISSEGEHFADTMATAFQVMRRLTDDPANADAIIAAVDNALPGVAQATNYLLQQPIYRHHPVNTLREQQRQQRLSAALLDLERVK